MLKIPWRTKLAEAPKLIRKIKMISDEMSKSKKSPWWEQKGPRLDAQVGNSHEWDWNGLIWDIQVEKSPWWDRNGLRWYE